MRRARQRHAGLSAAGLRAASRTWRRAEALMVFVALPRQALRTDVAAIGAQSAPSDNPALQRPAPAKRAPNGSSGRRNAFVANAIAW